MWRRTVLLAELKKLKFARNSGRTVNQNILQVTIPIADQSGEDRKLRFVSGGGDGGGDVVVIVVGGRGVCGRGL